VITFAHARLVLPAPTDLWPVLADLALHRYRSVEEIAATPSFRLITVGVDTTKFSATISPELAEARFERRAGGEGAALSERDSPRCAKLRR
jgi:hypothetical protein